MPIPNKFKPMLAEHVAPEQIKFPVLASPKLNGIRCIVFDGVGYSRSMKPLPNQNLQRWIALNADILEGMDGEIIAGSETAYDALNRSVSFCMKADREDDFTFWVFDGVDTEMTASQRYSWYDNIEAIDFSFGGKVKPVKQTLFFNLQDLIEYEKSNREMGYEGTMLKDPDGKYKFGRSTVKSGQLLKRKTFTDKEFKIVGYEQLMHNNNEPFKDELGRTKRSTSKENLVPVDALGALICETEEGNQFNVGTFKGFTMQDRIDLWLIRDTLPGQLATVQIFEEGMVNVPLLPVLLQIRHPIDMS
jgi:DNA ligase-1